MTPHCTPRCPFDCDGTHPQSTTTNGSDATPSAPVESGEVGEYIETVTKIREKFKDATHPSKTYREMANALSERYMALETEFETLASAYREKCAELARLKGREVVAFKCRDCADTGVLWVDGENQSIGSGHNVPCHCRPLVRADEEGGET